MSKSIIFVGALAFILAYRFRTVPSPVVTIDDGQLQGRIGHSRDGKVYFEYLSIPYAEPPVGNLRFEVSIKKKPWTGIKQATSYPPFCMQMDSIMRGKMYGVEDCLYLNVFTRGTKGKKPVMVYIHGGGFFSGSSNMYDPNFFMDHEDIVLVTINYRLGIFGFLNLQDGLIRGNMGLKDQLLAMKWVVNNIEKFGGDAGDVTLFGESAGAASVHYHMISPASKGLFHRAILQSGAVTCPWAFRHDPIKIANHYIQNTKCATEKGNKLVQCLKKIDPVDLVQQSLDLMDPTVPMNIFVPSVETTETDDTFLSENPRKLLKAGKIATNVPILLGMTSGEGALRTARFDAMSEVIGTVDKNWNEMAARSLLHDDADIPAEAAKELRKRYFGDKSFTESLHEFKRNFTAMASDIIFFAPIQKAAMLHAKYGAATFMYYYDYDVASLPNVYSLLRAVRTDDWIFADAKMAYAALIDLAKKKWFKSEGPHEFGITHGDDLLTLWNMEGWSKYLAGGDTKFSKAFVQAFVDFSSVKEPLKFDGVAWPAVKSGQSTLPPKYMLISKTPRVIEEPFTDSVRFWEKLNIRE